MMITLYKTDRNDRIRFYSISDRQGHLFSPYALTVSSGADLTSGRERMHVFETRRELDRKLQALIQSRIRDGYRVLYSYFRNHEYERLRPALREAEVS